MHGIDHRPTACCSFSDFKFHRNLRDLTSGFLYRNYALTFAALMKCRTIELTHHFAMVCSVFHSSIYITPNRLPNPRKKADTIFVDVVKKTKCQILFLATWNTQIVYPIWKSKRKMLCKLQERNKNNNNKLHAEMIQVVLNNRAQINELNRKCCTETICFRNYWMREKLKQNYSHNIWFA